MSHNVLVHLFIGWVCNAMNIEVQSHHLFFNNWLFRFKTDLSQVSKFQQVSN